MVALDTFFRRLILTTTSVAIATYVAAGIALLIYLGFIEMTEVPINHILVSVGALLLGLTGCIVLVGTFCENKQLKQDLLPLYWLLFSLVNALAFFLGLAELSYVAREFHNVQTGLVILPVSIIVTLLTVVVCLSSCVLHLLYRRPKALQREELKSPPTYEETVPPPKYEELFTPQN